MLDGQPENRTKRGSTKPASVCRGASLVEGGVKAGQRAPDEDEDEDGDELIRGYAPCRLQQRGVRGNGVEHHCGRAPGNRTERAGNMAGRKTRAAVREVRWGFRFPSSFAFTNEMMLWYGTAKIPTC